MNTTSWDTTTPKLPSSAVNPYLKSGQLFSDTGFSAKQNSNEMSNLLFISFLLISGILLGQQQTVGERAKEISLAVFALEENAKSHMVLIEGVLVLCKEDPTTRMYYTYDTSSPEECHYEVMQVTGVKEYCKIYLGYPTDKMRRSKEGLFRQIWRVPAGDGKYIEGYYTYHTGYKLPKFNYFVN